MNKVDFIRAGARGATYLAFRKAIQEIVSRQLAAWGDSRDTGGRARLRAAGPVERDLEAVLSSLADRYPLLASLVEQRSGGQRRLPVGVPATGAAPLFASASSAPSHESGAAVSSSSGADAVEPSRAAAERVPMPAAADTSRPAPGASVRPARYGLSIQFEPRGDDPELARLVESTVWVNEAHPAHRRAVASRSEGYHIAVAVAMALAPLAVEPSREHAFVTAFLASWGAALERRGRRRRG